MTAEVGFNFFVEDFIIMMSCQFCTVCRTASAVQFSLALLYFRLKPITLFCISPLPFLHKLFVSAIHCISSHSDSEVACSVCFYSNNVWLQKRRNDFVCLFVFHFHFVSPLFPLFLLFRLTSFFSLTSTFSQPPRSLCMCLPPVFQNLFHSESTVSCV
jgi:hypothetical protein